MPKKWNVSSSSGWINAGLLAPWYVKVMEACLTMI
jgi:hypothetical protein